MIGPGQPRRHDVERLLEDRLGRPRPGREDGIGRASARGNRRDDDPPQRVLRIAELRQDGTGELRRLLREPEQRRHRHPHPIDEVLC
ncbi:MAG: hypothetical protein ABW167_06930 [Baekduia sp.]